MYHSHTIPNFASGIYFKCSIVPMPSMTVIRVSALIVCTTVISLYSCSVSPTRNMDYIKHLIHTKTGINVLDSIHIMSIEDAGVDLHGTIAYTYTIGISNSDMTNAVKYVLSDSSNMWKENKYSRMLIVYPRNINDTLFGFSLLKYKSIIKIQISN